MEVDASVKDSPADLPAADEPMKPKPNKGSKKKEGNSEEKNTTRRPNGITTKDNPIFFRHAIDAPILLPKFFRIAKDANRSSWSRFSRRSYSAVPAERTLRQTNPKRISRLLDRGVGVPRSRSDGNLRQRCTGQ